MEGDESLDVLKDIREEARRTNERLEQTISRLESLEGRVDFFERRTSKGFEDLGSRMDSFVDRLDHLTRRQTDSELRLASEVLALADVTRQVRDLLSTKLDDHNTVIEHEKRIRTLEDTIADGPPTRD